MNSLQQSPFATQQKKKPVIPVSDSVIESFRSVGSDVGKTLAKDVAGAIPQDVLSSLLGQQIPQKGELRMNQEIIFSSEESPSPTMPSIEKPKSPIVTLVEKGIEQKIDAVRQDLKALAQSTKLFNSEVERAVSETPINPGIYHENYFEQLRSFIILMKTKIDDGRMWLQMWVSKKQKQGFWGMYKKHGTKFGLSSERTVATQAG